jgi:Kef-type K+ transport system membrane component KefB
VKLLLLAVLGLLAYTFRGPAETATPGAGTVLAFGYLLLSAYFVGDLFKRVSLPRLTGYIACGIVVGPSVLGLVPRETLGSLALVNGAATALIALTAGSEIDFEAMKPLLRSIAGLTLAAVLGTTVLLAGAVFAVRDYLPFMGSMTTVQAAAVAVVLGVVMVAQSPAVVVALRDEMAADGPVSRTVLGVVVIADLVVIVMFALASTLAKSTFGQGADAIEVASRLAWEIGGSVVSGLVIGELLALYLRKVQGSAGLFILAVAFVVAEVGQRLHFDPLIVALSAGMLIRNATGVGERLHDEIESASLPVYVLFFAVTGANLHLDILLVVGAPAAFLVLVRGFGLWAGTHAGARLAGAPPAVGRYAGFGLLPQAGLALALALLFAKTFPEFGEGAAALTLGVVALNELVAPILYRAALVRSGEAGRLAVPDFPEVDEVAAGKPAGH